MDDIIVRQYTEGDEYEITDLLTISGTHLRTAVYWRWSNIKTPFSRSICVVLEAHDKTIIGHYSIMNVKLFFNGEVNLYIYHGVDSPSFYFISFSRHYCAEG